MRQTPPQRRGERVFQLGQRQEATNDINVPRENLAPFALHPFVYYSTETTSDLNFLFDKIFLIIVLDAF